MLILICCPFVLSWLLFFDAVVMSCQCLPFFIYMRSVERRGMKDQVPTAHVGDSSGPESRLESRLESGPCLGPVESDEH